jgi:hypothetical protein
MRFLIHSNHFNARDKTLKQKYQARMKGMELCPRVNPVQKQERAKLAAPIVGVHTRLAPDLNFVEYSATKRMKKKAVVAALETAQKETQDLVNRIDTQVPDPFRGGLETLAFPVAVIPPLPVLEGNLDDYLPKNEGSTSSARPWQDFDDVVSTPPPSPSLIDALEQLMPPSISGATSMVEDVDLSNIDVIDDLQIDELLPMPRSKRIKITFASTIAGAGGADEQVLYSGSSVSESSDSD